MNLNKSALLMTGKCAYTDTVTFYVPTLKEIIEHNQFEFNLYVKVFTTTTREIYSGQPTIVDDVERQYPNLWVAAFDESFVPQLTQAMFNEHISLINLLVSGIAYFTHSNVNDFQILSNKKVVNKTLNWVIDENEFLNVCEFVKLIVLHEENKSLIAPRGMTPAQQKIWEKLYQGRVRSLKRIKSPGLDDKIVILQIYLRSIDMEQILKLNYFHFVKLLNGFNSKANYEESLQFYTSYKFDSSQIKLNNWKLDIIKGD